MSYLPKGWTSVDVGEIFHSFSGGTPDRSRADFWNGTIPWISSGDVKLEIIDTASEFISELGLRQSSAKICPKGSVIVVVRSGILKHTLPVAVLSNAAAINQDIKCFDSGDVLLNRWFAVALKATQRELLKENREGTTVQSVKYDTIKKFELPIPPGREQERILTKLGDLTNRVGNCRQRLERIPILLKRFRQSVLAAACSGKLTEDRRANDGISELPEGWCWKRLTDLLPPKGGLFDGPFGSNLKTDDYTNAGVRVVRLENVGPLRFFDDKRTYISKKKYESLRKHTVREGDIIFSSFISDEMRVCMLPRLGELAIAKADCFCIRPLSEVISPNYLLLQLACDTTLTALMASVHGATRPRVNISQLKELTIRMCPHDEQETIVSRASQLFELADQIEARYQKAKTQIDKLAPSILAKAFRGELVPQDPNDEPAEKLLERIRAARSNRQSDQVPRLRGKDRTPGSNRRTRNSKDIGR